MFAGTNRLGDRAMAYSTAPWGSKVLTSAAEKLVQEQRQLSQLIPESDIKITGLGTGTVGGHRVCMGSKAICWSTMCTCGFPAVYLLPCRHVFALKRANRRRGAMVRVSFV